MEVVGIGEAMKVYIITREGIYRHEILGVYRHLKDATRACEKAILDEKDDYHEILLSVAEVGKPIRDAMAIRDWRRGGWRTGKEKGEVWNFDYDPEDWVLDENQQWRLLDSRGKYI